MLNAAVSKKIPDDLIRYGQSQIQTLLNTVTSVDFVMLCSSDGFEIALSSKKQIANGSKIAAVSSSILAMVSAFIPEIDLHGCQTITLDAENGKALLTAVPHPRYPTVIVALTSKDVLLGQMLYEMKKVSADLAAYQVS